MPFLWRQHTQNRLRFSFAGTNCRLNGRRTAYGAAMRISCSVPSGSRPGRRNRRTRSWRPSKMLCRRGKKTAACASRHWRKSRQLYPALWIGKTGGLSRRRLDTTYCSVTLWEVVRSVHLLWNLRGRCTAISLLSGPAGSFFFFHELDKPYPHIINCRAAEPKSKPAN